MHLTISVLRFPPYQSSDKNQTWPANNAHAIMFSNPPTSNICPVPSCSFFLSFFFLLQVVLDSSSVEGFLHKRRNLFFSCVVLDLHQVLRRVNSKQRKRKRNGCLAHFLSSKKKDRTRLMKDLKVEAMESAWNDVLVV